MQKVYKLKLLQYELFGDEVNNIFTLIDDLVTTRNIDNMSDEQILKICHNQKFFGLFGTELIKIDFRSIYVSWADAEFIEFSSKKNDLPVGRLEIEEIKNA
jgi:hypothetical protein